MDTRLAGLILLLAATGACRDAETSGATASVPERWTVVEPASVEIGVVEGEDAYQLHEVTSVARLDDGRIVVANDGSKELRFFSSDGTFLFAGGREGGAPGEYRVLDRVRPVGADTLLVFDTYQPRISALDPRTGEYLGAVPMPEDTPFPFDEWIHGRTIVDSPLAPAERGVVAAALDSLPTFQGAEHRYARVSREGELWLSARKVPLPGEAVTWSVHDLEGRQAASVTTPASFTLHDVGPDWILGVWRDEVDVEHVRLYELERASAPREGELTRAAAAWEGPPPAFERVTGDEAATPRGTLMQMAMGEEIFYSEHLHYTLSVDSVRRSNPRLQPEESVEILPLWVEDDGWMFMAADSGAAVTCFISYGFVRLIGMQSGSIVCWRA